MTMSGNRFADVLPPAGWAGRARPGGAGTTVALVLSASVLIGILHILTPVDPDKWRWHHLLYQRLAYIPILMAAAWLGVRWTLAVAAVLSAFLLVHTRVLWGGGEAGTVQALQIAEISSFWVVALTSALLFERERRALAETAAAHEETLTALASSLDLRERRTALHSRRVRDYTLILARRMGIADQAVLDDIGKGALLHDVGKIGMPDRILLGPRELSEEERAVTRRHPELGAALIGEIGFLQGAREIVLSHHERFDGSGYPRGLAGRDIPVGARIFAVIDVFDALTEERPYHAPLSYREAADFIANQRGRHFDSDVVDAFLSIPCAVWAEAAARNGLILREA
jgi:putative nucleotidyltransferase with HDIG domain